MDPFKFPDPLMKGDITMKNTSTRGLFISWTMKSSLVPLKYVIGL